MPSIPLGDAAYKPVNKKTNIVYISGQMTGLPDFNFPEFNRIAKLWRDEGWNVVNPAENFGGAPGLDRNTHLKLDYTQLISTCNAIAVLPNWNDSVGARVEVTIAQSLDYPVFDALRPGVLLDLKTAGLKDQPYKQDDITIEELSKEDKELMTIVKDAYVMESDPERKQIIDGLIKADAIAREDVLCLYGHDYQKELAVRKAVTQAKEDANTSVCQIADRIVSVDRQKSYGHPKEDFARIAAMASGAGFRFQEPNGTIRHLEAKDYPIFMILVKISRQINSHKRDNLVDGAGYFKCADIVNDSRE